MRQLVVLVIFVVFVVMVALFELVFTMIAVQQLGVGMLLFPDVPANVAGPFLGIKLRQA